MKRILIVNQHCNVGGIRKTLENWVAYLSEEYEIDILFLFGDASEFPACQNVRILPKIKRLNAYYSSVAQLKKEPDFLFQFFLKVWMKCITKLFGEKKVIDSVLRSCKGYSGYDIAIAYSHDHWYKDGTFFGGCNYIVVNKTDAPKKLAWIHGEPDTIGLTAERILSAYENFDMVVNVSKANDERFRKLAGGKVKSTCIYNLFDSDAILSKAAEAVGGIAQGRFTFVTVARMDPVKRIDKVNAVARKLVANGYEFQWLVVGGGIRLEKYRQEANDLGLQGIVTYVGEESNPYKYMQAADVFVLLSDSEAFSTVVNEALIVGIPVLFTDVPMARECITQENGFIVAKDVDSIYEQASWCIDHPERIREMKTGIRKSRWGEALAERSIVRLRELLETS